MLLTVGSAVGGLLVWEAAGTTRELLVAARSIPAGHVLEPADLRAVEVGAADGVSVVAAGAAAELVGRPASIPVPAGALIPAEVASGAGVLPPRGWAVVSVAVAPGVVPPQAGPGATVRVLPVEEPAAAIPGRPVLPRGWDAVLLSVEPSGSGGVSVVSLQVTEADAAAVAAAAAKVAVVVLAGPR
ncbi:SAF domain-containing protein [Pseudonocardia sp.]|uniref:SAF domain-containing protein n=1 Tax=Pseudonocardia sp. TaxID=60912 RepID=UPI003D13C372